MFDQKVENLNVPEDVERARDTKCRYTIEEQVFINLNNVFNEFSWVSCARNF